MVSGRSSEGHGRGEEESGIDLHETTAARERVLADSAEARWARGPQLMLPVQPSLKDLGVAQGFGKEAKNPQAARVKIALVAVGCQAGATTASPLQADGLIRLRGRHVWGSTLCTTGTCSRP